MPPNPSLARLSYLHQTDLPADSVKLLEWLKFTQETIEENEQIISQLLVEKQNLINELENLQQEINAKANSRINFDKEGEDYFRLAKELELKEYQNQELNEINQVLERKLNQLNSLINKQIQEKEKNHQTIEELKETILEKEELITNLREKLSELNKKQQQYRKSKQDLEKQVNFLFSGQSQKQLQITKQQAQIDYLKGKNQELNNFQEQLLKEVDLEKKKVEQLQTYLKNNPAGREELLTSELEQTQEKLEQVENNLKEKKQIITDLESELVKSQAQFLKLKTEMKEQKEIPNQDHQTFYNKLQKLNQKFQTELVEKEKLLVQTNQELKTSNQRYSELLSKYHIEKKENGFPWGKTIIIGGIVVIALLLILFWKKIKILLF